MKVILQQDVKKVGKAGDVIEVSEGYGRNFLLPKKYAVEANVSNLNVATQKKQSAERKRQQAIDEAKLMSSQLSKVEVTIPVKLGENGKLFGSVSGKDVADRLQKDHHIEIDRRKIEISPVRGLGDYEAVVRVHPEISSKIKVHVIAEKG